MYIQRTRKGATSLWFSVLLKNKRQGALFNYQENPLEAPYVERQFKCIKLNLPLINHYWLTKVNYYKTIDSNRQY